MAERNERLPLVRDSVTRPCTKSPRHRAGIEAIAKRDLSGKGMVVTRGDSSIGLETITVWLVMVHQLSLLATYPRCWRRRHRLEALRFMSFDLASDSLLAACVH